jgi:phosphatidylserine/phosphatidylglycerophosphate/cardiolipin synthase-like enzyme
MIAVPMTYLLVATGFTGALTLVFLARWVHGWVVPPRVVSAHFSPKGGCTEAVVREIQKAHREVLVLAYSFTSKPITDALIEAKKRGVKVEIVLDRSNEQDSYSTLALLAEKGLAPLLDSHHAIAHNKVMMIDRHTLITGSFNFTHQAEVENAENLLVLKGHGELMDHYRQDFEVHKGHSQAHAAKPAAPADHKEHRKAA